MKITEIEVVRSRVPRHLSEPYLPAWFQPDGVPVESYSYTYYRVRTDEGITGIGPYGGEPDAFARRALIGKDPFFIERFFMDAMSGRELTFNRGSYGGLDVALWDIVGKATGQPVYRLLGGLRDRMMVYAATSRILEPQQHVDQILSLRELGFRAAKLRLHRFDPKEDLRAVQLVREAAGPDFTLVVDANQNHKSTQYHHWSHDIALWMAQALEDLGVAFLEEPLQRWDIEGLRLLAAQVRIPIAGGEHAADIYELREHLKQNAYDIFQPDVILGDIGISGAKKLSVITDYFGKLIIPHVCGLGAFALNFPAMLQVASTMPNCPMIEYPFDPPILTVESQQFMLRRPLVVESDGCVALPSTPGIGVEIDEE